MSPQTRFSISLHINRLQGFRAWRDIFVSPRWILSSRLTCICARVNISYFRTSGYLQTGHNKYNQTTSPENPKSVAIKFKSFKSRLIFIWPSPHRLMEVYQRFIHKIHTATRTHSTNLRKYVQSPISIYIYIYIYTYLWSTHNHTHVHICIHTYSYISTVMYKYTYKCTHRCPWCSGYRRWKWTRRHEFKSRTRLIAFHIALIPLGKLWIQLFSFQCYPLNNLSLKKVACYS